MIRLHVRRTPSAVTQAPVSDNDRSTAQIERVLAPLSQRYILVYPALQAASGSAKAALMLSQMLYWTRTYLSTRPERGGWFWHTQQDWRANTGLSRHEQDHARMRLLATGLVEERRMGALGRMHFRVDLEALGRAIARGQRHRAAHWSWDEATMKALLGRPVAFMRGLVDICGSFTAAFYLSDLSQQQRTLERNGLHGYVTLNGAQRELDAGAGWLDLPLGDTANRLGLTQRRLRLARRTLLAAGLIEECSSGGVQPRTLSRVNLSALAQALALPRKPPVVQPDRADNHVTEAPSPPPVAHEIHQNGQQPFDFTGMADSYIPKVTKPANWNGGNVHSRGDITGKLEVTKAANKTAGFVTSIKGFSTQREPLKPQLLPTSLVTEQRERPRSSGWIEDQAESVSRASPVKANPVADGSSLVLPEGLSSGEIGAAQRLIGNLPTTVSKQEVADEWAGQLSLGKVHNPLGYLFALVKRAHQGDFVPAMAYQHAQRRERRRQSEALLARARDPLTLALPATLDAEEPTESTRRGVPGFFKDRIKELGLGLRRNECLN